MKMQWLGVSLLLGIFLPYVKASNEVKCLCNDQTVHVPACGICGQSLGTMEPTATGAKCFCEGGLFNEEISCEETCRYNKGWSWQFAQE